MHAGGCFVMHHPEFGVESLALLWSRLGGSVSSDICLASPVSSEGWTGHFKGQDLSFLSLKRFCTQAQALKAQLDMHGCVTDRVRDKLESNPAHSAELQLQQSLETMRCFIIL